MKHLFKNMALGLLVIWLCFVTLKILSLEKSVIITKTYRVVGQDGRTPIAGVDFRIPEDGADAIQPPPGKNGADGGSCSTRASLEGDTVISCEDGTVSVVRAAKNGLSAYELATQAGFGGSVDEWLESLKAPDLPGYELRCASNGLFQEYRIVGTTLWKRMANSGKCVL